MNEDSQRLLANLIKHALNANPRNAGGLFAGLATQKLDIPLIFLESLRLSHLINSEEYKTVTACMDNNRVATLHVPAVTWNELQTGGWGVIGTQFWFHLLNKYHPSLVVTSSYLVTCNLFQGGLIAFVSAKKIISHRELIRPIQDQLANEDIVARLKEELAEYYGL